MSRSNFPSEKYVPLALAGSAAVKFEPLAVISGFSVGGVGHALYTLLRHQLLEGDFLNSQAMVLGCISKVVAKAHTGSRRNRRFKTN